MAGVLVLAALEVLVAVRFEWARNKWFFAIPIALWVMVRTASQVAVDEVPAVAQRGGAVTSPDSRISTG